MSTDARFYRLAALLWIVGGLLALANLALYVGYWQRSARIRADLAQSEQEIEQDVEALGALEANLSGLRLEQQNERVAFLNGLIGYRVFPWSELFDHLEEVLPYDVLLTSVNPNVDGNPRTATSRSRRSRSSSGSGRRTVLDSGLPEEVGLTLSASAKNDEALLELVENLFASPHFLRPDLKGESRSVQDGLIDFSITVQYVLAKPKEEMDDTVTAGTPLDGDAEAPLALDSTPGLDDEARGATRPSAVASISGTDSSSDRRPSSGSPRSLEDPSRAASQAQASPPGSGPTISGGLRRSDAQRPTAGAAGPGTPQRGTTSSSGTAAGTPSRGATAGRRALGGGARGNPAAGSNPASSSGESANPSRGARSSDPPPRIPPPRQDPESASDASASEADPPQESPTPLDTPASGTPNFRRGGLENRSNHSFRFEPPSLREAHRDEVLA